MLIIQHCFDSQIITCTDVKNINYLDIQVHIKYALIHENMLLVLYILFYVNNGFWDINKLHHTDMRKEEVLTCNNNTE